MCSPYTVSMAPTCKMGSMQSFFWWSFSWALEEQEEQMSSNQLHNAYSKKYAYEVQTNRERAAQRVMSPLAFPYLFHDVWMCKQAKTQSFKTRKGSSRKLVECLLSPYIYYNSSGLVGRVAGKTILFFVLFRPADFRVDRTDKHMPPFPLCMSSAEHRLIDVTHRLSEYTRCLTYGQFRS